MKLSNCIIIRLLYKTSILITITIAIGHGNLAGQTNITDSIEHQNYQRKFMLHFPPNFNTTTQRALVLNLHGGSGNMVNAQGFSMLNPVSDQNNFIVAWPQGYGIAPPGFSWADGRNTSADQAGIDDIGFIDKLIDTLITRYNVDTNRIYICGFSNGGFMVQRLACQLPDRFAALASLGSSMDTVLYQNCNPSKPIPMAFFNGTADPAMPYGGGPMQNPQVIPVVPVDSTVQFWVAHNNCQTASPVFNFPDTFTTDNSTAELYSFTNCDCNADVKLYKLINGGHTWPGVYVASQASVLGNTNRDINASVELWNFFKIYTLCDTTSKIDEQSLQSNVIIYPNPATSILNIPLETSDDYLLIIRNYVGQLMLSATNQSKIDVSNLPNGIYSITIQQGQKTNTKIFLKQ
jgi:polyhydroxybutyrate depolymerase